MRVWAIDLFQRFDLLKSSGMRLKSYLPNASDLHELFSRRIDSSLLAVRRGVGDINDTSIG